MPSFTLRQGVSVRGITSKTLGAFEAAAARIVGAQDRPDEVGALDALHMAIDKANETNWEWNLSDGFATTVAATAGYDLPSTTKTVMSVRVTTGNERRLQPVRTDIYDRFVADQSAYGMPMYYSLFHQGSLRRLKVYPTPDTVNSGETLHIKVYTDLPKPTDSSQIPAWPSFLDRFIVLEAQTLVGMWRGMRSEKLQPLMVLAEDALRGARMRDRSWHDEDVGIVMEAESAARWPWNHPMRSE